MKIVKRIVVFLILCLAVVGAFTLLKKAPELNLSVEDVEYLESQYGKSASTEASREGLSGVMMNVHGAPPIDDLDGSSAPPSMLSGDAPAFDTADDAPPFVPTIPAGPIASPVMTEAPAFVPPTPTVSPPPTPALDEAPPFPAVPVTAPPEPPTALFYPAYPVPSVAESPPPVSTAGPPTWNGPVTEVINMPSSVPHEPQEGSDVLGATAVSPVSPEKSVYERASANGFLRNETPVVAQSPYRRLPVTAEETTLKLIPEVVEAETETVHDTPFLTAMTTPMTEKGEAVTPPENPTQRYRQTSVRKDIAFSATKPETVSEAEPVISFVPGKPVEQVSTEPFTAEPAKAAASAVEPPQAAQTPFVPPNPARTAAPETAGTKTKGETDLSLLLRPTVTRFVKAQAFLADSGDPIKMRNAFIQLSKLYEQPELNDAERMHMRTQLDKLALSIIYSRNIHVLEPVHVVKSGETLESIASAYEITPALLMKINGLTGAQPLERGTELKVILGRFDAKISVSRRELTLILGGLYAGRFPVTLGRRIETLRGDFHVVSKSGAPHEKTLSLNNGVTLRGLGPNPGDAAATTVRLSEQDAAELFDILTEMSIIVFEN